MTEPHPNLSILEKVDPRDIARSADAFAEDVVFHFFNPRLPDIQGDYVGMDGLKTFFANMAKVTGGTFNVRPISTTAIGNELLVMHTENTMSLPGEDVKTQVVLVWRIVDGRITEVWDIPSVYTDSDG